MSQETSINSLSAEVHLMNQRLDDLKNGLKDVSGDVKELSRLNVEFRVISAELKMINKIVLKLDEFYVQKSEFAPVKNIAFSLVGVGMLAVLGSLLRMAIK